MSDIGHWKFFTEFDVSLFYGFIYRISSKTTNQEYIGKKQFFSRTRKKVKGRKNRKVIIKPSNWEKYTGSSKYLNEDIKKFGIESFTFQIESLHITKASLYYAEVEKQVKENVLREKLDNGLNKYYNRQISATKFIPPDELQIEKEHKL